MTDQPALSQPLLETLARLPDALWVIDARGALIYANARAAALFGQIELSADRKLWGQQLGLYHADQVTPWSPGELPLVKALEGHGSTEVAMFLRDLESTAGVELLVSSTPLPTPPGGAFILFRTVAPGPRHRQLRQVEHQRKAILDNIRDMAWLKDRDGRFIAVNQRSVEMYNVPMERWIGATDYEIYPRELADRFRADDEVVIQSRRQRCVEERIVDSNGIERWLETIKTPVFGEGGEVIGTTGTARDITERKMTERLLRTTNEELERRVTARTRELAEAQKSLVRGERLAVLGQVAGGVAHQIRNPLGAIMNATSILERRLEPTGHADVGEALRVIREEIRHANAIITGLLDFARVRTPIRQLTGLAEVVERVLRGQSIPPTVQVQRAYGEVPLLLIDADLIQSATYNLIRNAVEAMTCGGMLEISISTQGSHAVLSVTDTGSGISPQVRAHLFEPLHSTKPQGIGLGLITARTFVEAHDGHLVSIDVPRGARFELRLPVEASSLSGKL